MPDQSLTSALEFLKKRKDADLIEGIRITDHNIPEHVIIAVSDNEFYSIAEADLDPAIQEEPSTDQRVGRYWVRKGAQVWRCSRVTLETTKVAVQPAKAIFGEELPDLDLDIFAPQYYKAPSGIGHRQRFGQQWCNKHHGKNWGEFNIAWSAYCNAHGQDEPLTFGQFDAWTINNGYA